jgi:hypothetical protein
MKEEKGERILTLLDSWMPERIVRDANGELLDSKWRSR